MFFPVLPCRCGGFSPLCFREQHLYFTSSSSCQGCFPRWWCVFYCSQFVSLLICCRCQWRWVVGGWWWWAWGPAVLYTLEWCFRLLSNPSTARAQKLSFFRFLLFLCRTKSRTCLCWRGILFPVVAYRAQSVSQCVVNYHQLFALHKLFIALILVPLRTNCNVPLFLFTM